MTVFIQTFLSFSRKSFALMQTCEHLHENDSEVCILQGQVTQPTNVTWAFGLVHVELLFSADGKYIY